MTDPNPMQGVIPNRAMNFDRCPARHAHGRAPTRQRRSPEGGRTLLEPAPAPLDIESDLWVAIILQPGE